MNLVDKKVRNVDIEKQPSYDFFLKETYSYIFQPYELWNN